MYCCRSSKWQPLLRTLFQNLPQSHISCNPLVFCLVKVCNPDQVFVCPGCHFLLLHFLGLTFSHCDLPSTLPSAAVFRRPWKLPYRSRGRDLSSKHKFGFFTNPNTALQNVESFFWFRTRSLRKSVNISAELNKSLLVVL